MSFLGLKELCSIGLLLIIEINGRLQFRNFHSGSKADKVATNRAIFCDFWNLLCLGGVHSQTNLCTWIRFSGYNDLGLVTGSKINN